MATGCGGVAMMKNLHEKLYEKADQEFEKRKEEILQLEPRKIVDAAYELIVKEDILSILEEMDVSDLGEETVSILLDLDNVLQYFYRGWLDVEDSHMEELKNSIIYDAKEYSNYKKGE